MTAAEVREAYCSFFERHRHIRVPSDSLLPSNDPTLLFTSAGMVQFKPLYTAKDRPYVRATSCQRCLRTTDIERVGMTARHLTFFEMLGNFSFGDYFKEGAIEFGWTFLTKELRLDPKRLHISVFEKDAEAESFWKKYNLPNQIVKFGDEDNYWPAGSALNTWAGPNGACSEIYYDFGERFCRMAGHASPCSAPGQHECDRFREIWNLVFPEFLRNPTTGENPRMPKPGIDTGMGLERMCTVMQEKDSVFDTDVLSGIMDRAEALLKSPKADLSPDEVVRTRRIIADHVRAATFMVADGIVPSNEGRGYVLRRLIRRATRQSGLYGNPFPIVSALVPDVVHRMGVAYPEIAERQARVVETIKAEEERFVETVGRGVDELEKERASGTTTLTGDRAFYFHDTFGFPRELTEDIWTREMKKGLSPSFEAEYKAALTAQQERARAAWKGSGAKALGEVHHALAQELGATAFLGYDGLTGSAKVLAIVKTGGESGAEGLRVKSASTGETVEVILDATPLYAESGGQVADHGRIIWTDGEARVEDVQKPLAGMFIHALRIVKGELKEGQAVTAEADSDRRRAVARHHTATHLLHAGLHTYVGKSATQAGSLVAPDRLRFDFMSGKAVPPEALRSIEEMVNAAVLEAVPVTTTVSSLADAKKKGAMMLFGEKYGDKVRLVEIGEVSKELCGGTHVANTAAIGPFMVTAESSVASGVRRIEAVSGQAALASFALHRESVERTSYLLKCPPRDLEHRVKRLLEEKHELEQKLAAAVRDGAAKDLASKSTAAELIHGVKVMLAETSAPDPASMRELADRALDSLKSGIVVLGGRGDGKCHLIVRVSADLAKRAPAGEIVKVAAAAVGGTGGGRPDMAQAGGKDPAKLPEALARAREHLEKVLAG